MSIEAGRMPALDRVTAVLGGETSVTTVMIPLQCRDGFAEAFDGRPEAFLEERVRRAQSAWDSSRRTLRSALSRRWPTPWRSGEWDREHGPLRTQALYAGALRLIVSHPPGD
jgi:hypothetical protein